MLARLNSISLFGLEGTHVKVEVDIRNGMPGFSIIGLPDTMVRESRERVLSAIKNCGYSLPTRRIIVNLAPANVKKQGTIFDLPIAIGILLSSNQIELPDIENTLFAGELSLDGLLSPLNGALCISSQTKEMNFKRLILPKKNMQEASLVHGINIIGAESLSKALDKIRNNEQYINTNTNNIINKPDTNKYDIDFSDVKGQFAVKRAIEIAVSGGHNVMMSGPPGSGKSMIAKRIPTIMPSLTIDEVIETTKIYSIANKIKGKQHLINKRPFRSPHHSASDIAIIGGGDIPKPGEITLAHNGVLFLDELPYFRKSVLQSLREPLEDSLITISRSSGSATFPSDFMLICAMNPCPCGYLTHSEIECTCSPKSIQRYLSKLSGPFLDRIDIFTDVPKIDFQDFISKKTEETSEEIRKRIEKVRKIQYERFIKSNTKINSGMKRKEIEKYCELDNASRKVISLIINKLKLSGRGYDRILKVSRTIADMDMSERIEEKHIMEALQYRQRIFDTVMK